MKIDTLGNAAFEGTEIEKPKEVQENSNSLSAPFINPYSKKSRGLTAAERNNNPFNIKYGKFAASYGATKENKNALDGGSFATFPSVQSGLDAAKNLLTGNSYKNLTVDQALKKWSNNGYGGEIIPNISQKRIADLNPIELDTLQRKQIVREDKQYANKLGYYKYGGKIKKMAIGGTTPKTPKVDGEGFQLDAGLLSSGLGIAGGLVDSFDNNPLKVNKAASVGGGVLKGAASGAALGSVIPGWGTAVGAAVGGIVGGVTSVIKNKKRQKLLNQTIATDQRNFNNTIQDRSTNLYRQLNPYQYKYGGKIDKTKPYITSNPNDPRIRAYNDSASLYNNYQDLTKSLKREGYNQTKMGKQSGILGAVSGILSSSKAEKSDQYTNLSNRVIKYPKLFNSKKVREDMYVTDDLVPWIINEKLPKQLISQKIKPSGVDSYGKSVKYGEAKAWVSDNGENREMSDKGKRVNIDRKFAETKQSGISKSLFGVNDTFHDDRLVARYDNVKPKQQVIYEPAKPKTVITQKVNIPLPTAKPIVKQIVKTPINVNPIEKEFESTSGLPEIKIPNAVPVKLKEELKSLPSANPRETMEAYQRRLAGLRKANENTYKTSTNQYKYKYGGNPVTADWEAERGEIVQGDSTQLEDGKQITPNLHEVKGRTHEQGGTLGSGGDRIFSNSLSFNGKSPADLAKSIAHKLKKFEPNLSAKDRMKRVTAERMSDKLNQSLDNVFNMQEQYKNSIPKYKYGGNIPKYLNGGKLTEEEKQKLRVDRVRNSKGLSTSVTNNRRPTVGQKQFIPSGNKPWNPLDSSQSKLGIPITKDYFTGNNLDEVLVKGKRTLTPPVKSRSGVAKSLPKIATKTQLSSPQSLIARQTPVNPLAKQLLNNTNNLANLTKPNTVAGKTKQDSGLDSNLLTGLGLTAAGYINSANNINRMRTDVPVNLTQSPYYNYTDRSRSARTDLNANANVILRNPNISAGQKQALFSRLSGGINQINSQENNNRLDYDQQFNNQSMQINAQNNAILTQAQQQRIANENAKLGLKSQNFNSALGNVNTTLAEQEARKLDQKKFSILANSYKSKYNTDFDIKI